jgi:hypothetical protein
MAYFFGDSFDFYATTSDPVLNYWDSGTSTAWDLVTGRFAGSRAAAMKINITAPNVWLQKSSGVNEPIHHLIFSFQQTCTLSGTVLGAYISLMDGTTAQCSLVFRTDGAIVLTSGGPAGSALATYTGAINAQNTWTPFEIELVIHNTAGSITVRKNGNTGTPDFTLGSLNTRTTANNYANRLQVGSQVDSGAPLNTQGNPQMIDDLLWRSDPTSVAWLGDIRAYQQMPASDVSDQFSASPATQSVSQTAGFTGGTQSRAANAGLMSAFTATYSGTISSGTISVNTGGTGNMKAAIYDSTRTTVLATSNAVVNPVAGNNTITFGTPLTVVKGTQYWLAVDQDTTIVYNVTGVSALAGLFTTTYASFPAGSPTVTTSVNGIVGTVNIVPTNNTLVNEAQQDGATSYVFDSTVGHADLYAMTPLASTPQSIVAVTIRGFMAKSDAGTRAGALQLKSGATTVQSTPLFLSTNFLWNYRTDLVDPNTGVAWSAAAVNAAQIGPVVNT